MWPPSQTMSGLLQFTLSIISLVAARLYDHWRRLHTHVAKHARAVSRAISVRSAHNAPAPRHARTRAIHQRTTLGERLADAITSGMGSWRFIIVQTALVAVWMLLNLWLLSRPFDPFPFILLNLAFSTQAAYASPLILMSQNRQSAKDRVRDDQEAREVDLMTRQLKLLETINRQQSTILQELRQRPGQSSQSSSRS